jgi:hypothetical protein
MSSLRAYLLYLCQAAAGGLPPDNRKWDVPCPRFQKTAAELLRRGWARRRWFLFGPVGITNAGIDALHRKDWS